MSLSLDQLPQDLWFLIVQKLDGKDLLSLSAVNHRLHDSIRTQECVLQMTVNAHTVQRPALVSQHWPNAKLQVHVLADVPNQDWLELGKHAHTLVFRPQGRGYLLELNCLHKLSELRGLGKLKHVSAVRIRNLRHVPNPLPWLESIDLSNTPVKDISGLFGIPHVTLSGCIHITDATPLRKAHHLVLDGCTSLTDVSCLGQVHSLDLSHTNISDVSRLGSVHRLKLRNCHGIRSVRGLETVHELDLTGCGNLANVEVLDRVPVLIWQDPRTFERLGRQMDSNLERLRKLYLLYLSE